MRKPERQLAEFEKLWLEQMDTLISESLLRQINFVISKADRLIAYYYDADTKEADDLIYKVISFIRRTFRNVARFTVMYGKDGIDKVINKSNIRKYKDGQVVSVFENDRPIRTYCVFQKCDDYGLNRLVDKICGNVQTGIDYYSRMGEVLFIPDHNEKEDMPKNIMFLNSDKLTVSDIEWLRANQDHYGTPITECIQRDSDNGELGITRGIHVKVIDDFVSAHQFLVELRHIY